MAKEFITSSEISDVMIERPVSFSIKGKHYSVFPATLGKLELNYRLAEVIGLSKSISKTNILKVVTKASFSHRDDCLRMIAYATLPGDECLDENKVQKRLKELKRIDNADIASLLFVILTQDRTKKIEKHFLIDKENERLQKVVKFKKKDKSSLSFGGRSVWGTLIDAACQRYGWSYQYVLWGISFTNLQLMLSDQIRDVFLTKEERKSLRLSDDDIVIDANDVSLLNQFIKTQSWK